MGNFKGISPEGLMLLAENRFNDSKVFYDAHKDEIKEKVIKPVYDLINDLQPILEKTDPEMNLVPSRMVSRVRRDTRFSKDKAMYRENMWVMFMRDKRKMQYRQPCMWFEFTMQGYNYGVGLFWCDSKAMELFRKELDEHGDEFLKALNKIKKLGIVPNLTQYKKDRSSGKDQRLKEYYNAKELYFMSPLRPLDKLFDGSCEEELERALKAFAPMYNFFMRITLKLLGGNEND